MSGPAGIASSTASPATRTSIVFADLQASLPVLEAEETATPRLATDQIARFENISSKRGDDEARLWRAAHIALRMALERDAGMGVRGVAYQIAAGGRPGLPVQGGLARRAAFSHPPFFSLSHTGPFALIALSHAGPIGVDLEMTRTITVSPERRQRIERAAAQLASSVLPGVSNSVEASSGESAAADARFLQAWVRLEAVAKASGLGIGRILTEAGVTGGGGSQERGHADDHGADHVRDLALPPGCFGAVSGPHLPALLLVEPFPLTAPAIAGWLAAPRG